MLPYTLRVQHGEALVFVLGSTPMLTFHVEMRSHQPAEAKEEAEVVVLQEEEMESWMDSIKAEKSRTSKL